MLLKPLIDLHGEPKNWNTAVPLYIEALSDIPELLLAKAVRHAIASNPFFPKPGDLRLSISDELAEHYRRKREGAVPRLPPPPERPRLTAEDIAYVDRAMARMRGAIRDKSDFLKDDDERSAIS